MIRRCFDSVGDSEYYSRQRPWFDDHTSTLGLEIFVMDSEAVNILFIFLDSLENSARLENIKLQNWIFLWRDYKDV